MSECFEHRGPEVEFEYGVYEARLFAEMLWKGSVLIQEVSSFTSVGKLNQNFPMIVKQKLFSNRQHLFDSSLKV